jgi:hypothetical protein
LNGGPEERSTPIRDPGMRTGSDLDPPKRPTAGELIQEDGVVHLGDGEGARQGMDDYVELKYLCLGDITR